MPKVIDHYVLQQKIGSGQFGNVYKGYHQDTNQQVAIKAIKRQMIKGKFYELLENQIKVLKTCDNPHIIKMYQIKKTANNFYLVLQYCDGGDMLAYVRKHQNIPQNQVIKFFCQILSAFQTLVKHRIMHRDFKLANILLHKGQIKIADFGFAKLLSNQDYATTMLGSPLNMAPQVLGGNKYNSKADIWSIAACIFQILTGKPPYVASNMVDLLKIIKNKPILYPKICQPLKDVMKKMFVVDTKRRISWNDLFSHPINTYLDQQLRKNINLQLAEDESLLMNTSKFYLKQNLVISRPEDINQKQEVNDYLLDVIHNKEKKQQFNGSALPAKHEQNIQQQKQKINRQEKKMNKKVQKEEAKMKVQQQSVNQSNLLKSSKVNNNESSLSVKNSKIFRNNSKKILYYRNIYAFLAIVSDQIIKRTQIQKYQISAYIVIQKILNMINWLKDLTQMKQSPLDGLQNWSQYINQQEFKQIKKYITKQCQVFQIFNQTIQPIVKANFIKGQYQQDIKKLLALGLTQQIYQKYLLRYVKQISKNTVNQMLKAKQIESYKQVWKHIDQVLIARNADRIFGQTNFDFDFKDFYEQYNNLSVQQLLIKVQNKLKQIQQNK